jgi:hypothetical protein
MKMLLVSTFVIGSCWDTVTSFLGIIGLFGVTTFQISDFGVYITALIVSLIILAVSLNFDDIWDSKDDTYYYILKPLSGVTIFFDAYTSYLGTAQYIILRNNKSAFITVGFEEVWIETSFEQKIILLFTTVLVTVSPILFTKLKRDL